MTGRVERATYLRTIIFGVEDSLVSTVGLISGVAIAGVPQATIMLTGVVLIFVEAFSMAAGTFLSEHSAEDYLHRKRSAFRVALLSGTAMFFSYFVAGFLPLIPYVILPPLVALWWSIGLSFAALFMLGFWGGLVAHDGRWQGAWRMLIIGGMAIAVGVLVGQFVS